MVCCSLFFSFLFLGLTCLLQLEFLRESYAVYTPLRWCTYMYIIIKCRGHILLIAVRHSHKHTCITKRQSAALIIVLLRESVFILPPQGQKKEGRADKLWLRCNQFAVTEEFSFSWLGLVQGFWLPSSSPSSPTSPLFGTVTSPRLTPLIKDPLV